MAQSGTTTNYTHGVDVSDGTNGGLWCNGTQVIDADGTVLSATGATFTDITGSDSSLGISGQAAAQGGAIALVGGTSSTAGNAGGAVTTVGGTPGATGVGGAVALTGGVGGATSGAGGAATLTGGAGTAGNSAGGAATVTGGAGQGTAAGGVASLVGGASGAGATGNGASAAVTGGAALSTNGSGGSVVLTPGVNTGTGIAGGVFQRSSTGQIWKQQPTVPADLADTAPTLTAAQMLTGILTGTPTVGRAYTLPTGTNMEAGAPAALATGDSFELTIINLAVGADDIITLTAAAGFTIVGKATIEPANAAANSSFATFRCARTAANTFVAYRIG